MEKKIFLPLIIISILIGFGIGKISERGAWQAKLDQAQKETDWLKSQLETFYPPLPEEIYRLSGTVIEKGDNFLTMEAQIQVSQFPLPEGKEIKREKIKVKLTEETEISQLKIAELPPTEERFEPFEKISLSFEEIEIGDLITVTSEENIKDKKEITAKEIQIGF